MFMADEKRDDFCKFDYVSQSRIKSAIKRANEEDKFVNEAVNVSYKRIGEAYSQKKESTCGKRSKLKKTSNAVRIACHGYKNSARRSYAPDNFDHVNETGPMDEFMHINTYCYIKPEIEIYDSASLNLNTTPFRLPKPSFQSTDFNYFLGYRNQSYLYNHKFHNALGKTCAKLKFCSNRRSTEGNLERNRKAVTTFPAVRNRYNGLFKSAPKQSDIELPVTTNSTKSFSSASTAVKYNRNHCCPFRHKQLMQPKHIYKKVPTDSKARKNSKIVVIHLPNSYKSSRKIDTKSLRWSRRLLE